ncbi:hypothetical protein GE061_008898 [Apolygus lucorum]|uniref:Uncharacterized protein n=1 Tax=Apolygus lucorum TaxID=248454 RepID=A0A8S9Y057_APOLU|nr:hypothetical protein GE061_008898 [Apolygus lucorum]
MEILVENNKARSLRQRVRKLRVTLAVQINVALIGCQVTAKLYGTCGPWLVNLHSSWFVAHSKQILRDLIELKIEKLAKTQRDKERSISLIEALPLQAKRAIKRIVEGNASQWLSVIPLAADNLDLSTTQFRDAISMRYGRKPSNLPTKCDGCEAVMTLNHALNCKKGGLVKRGHDQVRDEVAELAKLAWRGVMVEPIMLESGDGTPGLIADIKVQDEAARAKHHKYDGAAEDLRGSFTPLITSCEGVLHREFSMFEKNLVDTLSDKWGKPRSVVAGWAKVKIQMAVIRAVSIRLRESRRPLRGISRLEREVNCGVDLGLEDGAPLPLPID